MQFQHTLAGGGQLLARRLAGGDIGFEPREPFGQAGRQAAEFARGVGVGLGDLSEGGVDRPSSVSAEISPGAAAATLAEFTASRSAEVTAGIDRSVTSPRVRPTWVKAVTAIPAASTVSSVIPPNARYRRGPMPKRALVGLPPPE